MRGTYGGIEVTDLGNGLTQIGYNDFMYQGTGDKIERLDGVTTDIALDWLKSGDSSTPSFMYFNFQASHTPFNALPAGFAARFFTEQDDLAVRVRQSYMSNVPLDDVVKAYWDALHYVDQNLARVVDYLKSTGQHENTIYVISADTSIRLTAGLIGNGGELFPDVLKVPVILVVPGMSEREIIEDPVEQIDIMPTVLSVIGIGPHPASQGVNVLENRNPDRVLYAVAQTPAAHQYSAIYRDWQLVHDYNVGRYEFSYIGKNPQNAVDRPLSAQQAEWMLDKLSKWRNSQIAYYSLPEIQTLFYPPRYESDLFRSGDPDLISSINTGE